MRLLALITLAVVTGVTTKAQPAPFAQAVISRSLTQRMENAERWEVTWIDEVVLQPLSAQEKQEVLDRYKGRVPQPKLEATRQVPPMYPLAMRKKGVSGQATVYVVIAKDGSVKEVYVTDYSDEVFAKAAAFSLKFWTFGRLKQECLVAIPVPFNSTPDGAGKN